LKAIFGRSSAGHKNKSQKPVSFFSSQNAPSKAPRLPHIAPQIDHQKHDVLTSFLQKPLEKPSFSAPQLFPPQIG
jgi:hypothetical protein